MDAVFEQATSIIYQHQRTVFSRVAIYPTELLEPEIANTKNRHIRMHQSRRL